MPGKFRCKLVEIFGKNYWIEMSEQEYRDKWDDIYTIDGGVHNKEQFQKKMVQLMDTDLKMFETTPYRFYSYHDYDDQVGYLIILFNHAWIDGIQIVSMFSYMSEKIPKIPLLPTMTTFQLFMSHLLAPLAVAWLGLKTLVATPDEDHCLKKPSGHVKLNRAVRISDDFNFTHMRK